MKKFLLLILLPLFLITTGTQAQTTRWYSYGQYLTDHVDFVDSTNMAIWNDTTSKLGYMSGGSPYYYLNNFTSVGMSFAPVLSAWNDPVLYGSTIEVSPSNAYTIDSVRIRGTYMRNNAKTAPIDTIYISFVYGNGTLTSNLENDYFLGMTSHYGYDTVHFLGMACDTLRNIASNFPSVAIPPYTQYLTLTHTDTATNFDRYIRLTTPYPVPAGNTAAMSVTFKSGDASFTYFDTVLYASGAAKYGVFLPRIKFRSDGAGSAQFPPYSPVDSNEGSFRDGRSSIDYEGWTGLYIPNWAWTSAGVGASTLQYPDFDFHISCPTCLSTEAISGTTLVCVGATTSLSSATGGGTWSSSNTGIATVGSTTGVVTGVSGGTVNISYTTSGGSSSIVVTVNPLPDAGTISGATAVCVGSSITLSDSAPGGVWASSVPSAATVGSTTGVVTGVLSGITGISYTTTNACGSTTIVHVVTVNVFGAGSVTGPATLCTGASLTFMDPTADGVWTSSTPGVATIGSSGVATGIGTGTATISYTVTNACGTAVATAIVSVDVAPVVSAITGTLSVCSGLTTPLSDATPGGTWSSITTGVATISSSGVVTGVGAGISGISYTVTTGCGASAAIAIVTVNTAPVVGSITGPSGVCIGGSINLTDASAGGSWTSGSPGIATVGTTSGVVTGVSTGTATISYTVSNSCGSVTATTNIAVNTAPFAGTITGLTHVCQTASITLSDAVTGGTWNASNGHAFISSTGTVLGVTAGVDTMMYTVTVSCATTTSATATLVITVDPAPSAGTLTGPDSVCVSHSITLSDAVTGGSWSASNANAFVSSTGVVLGITTGTDDITYTVTNSCGTANADALITIYDCSLGVNNLPGGDISLYPNPTQNSITINAAEMIKDVVISNIFGQEVFVGNYNSATVVIGLDRLPAGIYVAKINGDRVYKIIKQ